MEESLVLFHYQAYSFHCESILNKLGFVTHFMPTPKQYGELCANSLRVKDIAPEELINILRKQGIDYAEVHTYIPSRLSEIFLQNNLSQSTEGIFSKIRQDLPLEEEEINYLYNLDDLEEKRAFWFLAWSLKKNVRGQSNEIGVFIRIKSTTNSVQLLKSIKELLERGPQKWLLTAEDNWNDLLTIAAFLQGRAEVAVTGGDVFTHFASLKKAGVKQIFKGLTKAESELYYLDDNKVLKEVIDLWRDGRTHMLGISPVLPVLEAIDREKGKQLTALLRVLFRDAQIPAFNVVSSLSGQLGLEEAGADLFYFELKENADFSADYVQMQQILNQEKK